MIDTAQKRRSAIDFGKGARGTGMPIPVGLVGIASRANALNLYSGIAPINSFFFFWRTRRISGGTFQARPLVTSSWATRTDAPEDIFVPAKEIKDS